MATITPGISKEYLAAYDGYDEQEVSLGLVTGLYHSSAYQRKKIKKIAIGLLSEITYAGSEHDRSPLILPWVYESAYNTLLAYNLHYVPEKTRRAIMQAVLKSNATRIRTNQTILIDYHMLKAMIPDSQYIVRRYKTIGINPIETYSLTDIPEAIKGKSRWDNWYLEFKRGSKR